MNTFPLEFSKHILFCIIGGAFFLFQYYRQGYRYQLLTAGAIGCTLLLYINDSTTWRYIVGVLELLLLVIIFATMSKDRKKAITDEDTESAEKPLTQDAGDAADGQ